MATSVNIRDTPVGSKGPGTWILSPPSKRAESVNSLHLRRHTVQHMKAAIEGSGSSPHHAAPATKVSNAQEAEFAKFGLFRDSGDSCRVQRKPSETPQRTDTALGINVCQWRSVKHD